MFDVEISNMEVEEKNVQSKRDGRSYLIRNQQGRIAINNEVRNVRIPLEQGQQPYAKGKYEIDRESFYVNNFGELKLGRVKLKSNATARAA